MIIIDANLLVYAHVSSFPQPTETHSAVLGKLLYDQSIRENLVPDAHLAALAIEHGLVLCLTEGDFARFSDLRWENPILWYQFIQNDQRQPF